jgi:hypothetical protein
MFYRILNLLSRTYRNYWHLAVTENSIGNGFSLYCCDSNFPLLKNEFILLAFLKLKKTGFWAKVVFIKIPNCFSKENNKGTLITCSYIMQTNINQQKKYFKKQLN